MAKCVDTGAMRITGNLAEEEGERKQDSKVW